MRRSVVSLPESSSSILSLATSWAKRLLGAALKKRSGRRRRDNRILSRPAICIEPLEDRTLFAADGMAVVHQAVWLFDTNRDPTAEVDLNYGLTGDAYFSGHWTGGSAENPGVARTGSPDGLVHWYLDTDGDSGHEIEIDFGFTTDTPVTGDWDGDGTTNVGVVRKGSPDGLLHWYLDTDGDPDAEIEVVYGLPTDSVVTGDWDHDGRDDVGVVRKGSPDGLLHWYLDTDRDPTHEMDIAFGVPGDRPIVGDWDGNGDDNVGVTHIEPADGLMHWLLDNDGDKWAEDNFAFGLPGDTPVPGNYRFPEIVLPGYGFGETVRLSDSDFEKAGSAQQFVVRNQGTAPLQIGAVDVPAGFQLVKGLGASIAPGASDTLIVKADTSVPGERTGKLRIANNDGNESSFPLNLTAKVRVADLEIEGIANGASAILRGVQGYATTAELTIRNRGSAPASIQNVNIQGNFLRIGGPGGIVAPQDTTTLTLQLPTGSVGEFRGELTFDTNDPGDRTFRIHLEGYVAAPMAKATVSYLGAGGRWYTITDNQRSAIDFGAATVGDVNEIQFKVENKGNIPLVLGQPIVPAGFILKDGLVSQLRVGADDTFTVALDTRSTGAKMASITFDTNVSGVDSFAFPVTGSVAAPELTLSATSLDFDISRGAAVNKSITITNDGDGKLRLSLPPLPTGYKLLNPLPTSVDPHTSITVTFVLTGSVPGSRIADVTLSTNDSDERTTKIHLSGVVGPFFRVTQTARWGRSNEYFITVTNDTDQRQKFAITYQAAYLTFVGDRPTGTVAAGTTVTYRFTLSRLRNEEILRFATDDPTDDPAHSRYVFSYNNLLTSGR